MRVNRVYLNYLTSKTQALFAPSRLRDREASSVAACVRNKTLDPAAFKDARCNERERGETIRALR
jgi:hypothetical protein